MNLEAATVEPEFQEETCIPDHCFHAFDSLFCALTGATPLSPDFPDDK